MAKSRQQLIQGSSFLSDQKEKIGGLNVNRSTITADSFKKGTSQESTDIIEKRVAANEKKITLLKKIIQIRKQNVDKQIKGEDTQQQMGGPLLESLQSIASTVDSIRDSLIQKQEFDESSAEKLRREKEEQDREDQEKGLESTKPKFLENVGSAVLKPVMGLWGRIWKFISTLFLGKIMMKFLDWFSNPENQGKIQSFIRFIKDWWPALTAAVLLFGTGFGSLVSGLVGLISFVIPKLLLAIKKIALVAAANPLKAAAVLGGGALLTGILSSGGDNNNDEKQEEPLKFNKGGSVPGSGNTDTVPAMLTPGEFVMSKGAVQEYGVDTLEGMNAAAGGTNIPTVRGGYNEGGKVKTMSEKLGHTRGTVTDPKEKARIEAETLKWVNKERVEFLGLPPLDKITYAAGVELTKAMGPEYYGKGIKETSNTDMNFDTMTKSTWKTKSRGAETIFQGSVGRLTEEDKQAYLDSNPNARLAQALHQQIEMDNLGADISARAKMNGGGLVQGYFGGGRVRTQEEVQAYFDNQPNAQIQALVRERNEIERDPDGKIRGADRKKYKQLTKQISDKRNEYKKMLMMKNKISTTPTQTSVKEKKKGGGLFGGLFGGGKKEGGSSGILGPISSNVDDMVDMEGYEKPPKTDGVKKRGGGSSGILGKISSNVDMMVDRDKYEVQPKPKKSSVIAYEQEATNQQQNTASGGGGNEIPSFDVKPPWMIDDTKLEVLGMMV